MEERGELGGGCVGAAWSKGLVTNYREWGGRYKTGGGGALEVLTLRKGGGSRKSFSHAEGGVQQIFG